MNAFYEHHKNNIRFECLGLDVDQGILPCKKPRE